MEFQTAELYDEYGNKIIVAEPIFKNYGMKKCFGGEIVTVKCHEDNSFVREILDTDGKGKILVIDGGGSLRCALLGDLLAKKGIDNGWEGVVVNGCIRDSRIINQMEIGIKALNTNPTKSQKRGVGLLNENVNFANVNFKAGHFIYADEDGIVVSEKKLI